MELNSNLHLSTDYVTLVQVLDIPEIPFPNLLGKTLNTFQYHFIKEIKLVKEPYKWCKVRFFISLTTFGGRPKCSVPAPYQASCHAVQSIEQNI